MASGKIFRCAAERPNITGQLFGRVSGQNVEQQRHQRTCPETDHYQAENHRDGFPFVADDHSQQRQSTGHHRKSDLRDVT